MGTNEADKKVADAIARKRADREAERVLDEQSRAARGTDYATSQLRSPK